MKSKSLLMIMLGCVLALGACSDDDGPKPDGGVDATVDKGPAPDLAKDTGGDAPKLESNYGEGCNDKSDCKPGSPLCIGDPANNSLNKNKRICSSVCTPDDPQTPLLNEDNCGPGLVCAALIRISQTESAYGCVKTCQPSLTQNPCPASSGHTCSPTSTRYTSGDQQVCWEAACEGDKDCPVTTGKACKNDTECTGEGTGAFCDAASGLCALPGNCTAGGICGPHQNGTATAKVGDPCTGDKDCPNNGACITDRDGYPQGYCTIRGCSSGIAEFACPTGATCHRLFFGGWCHLGCDTADPTGCRNHPGDKYGDYDCYAWNNFSLGGVTVSDEPVCAAGAFSTCDTVQDCASLSTQGNTDMLCRDPSTGTPTSNPNDPQGVCLDNTTSGPLPGQGKAKLRIAHLSPDAPAVKVCARPAGTTGAFAELTTALSGGLSYKQVTTYIEVDPGTYTAKIVAATGDCTGAAVFEGDLPALSGGAQATVVASGLLNATPSSLAVTPLIDEATDAAKAKLRFVHASHNTPLVDVGVYNTDKTFNKLFANAEYLAATGAAAPTYVALDAAIADTLDVDVRVPSLIARYATLRLPTGVSVGLGANATVFAHGTLTTSPLGGVAALACVDSAPGASGLATCVDMVASPAAPALAKVRAGHFSKGAPTVTACARPKGFTGAFAKVYATATLSYGDFGYSVDVPADTYELKVVAGTDCTVAGAAAVDSPALASEGAYSVVAGGDLAATPSTLALFAFVDDSTAPGTGNSRARLIHLGVDAPAVDVGVVNGAAITKVWNNAAYGAPTAPQVNGVYQDFAALTTAVAFGYTAAGQSTVLNKTAVGITSVAGTIYTAVAAGKLDTAATPPSYLEIFLCDDSLDTGGDGKVSCTGPVAVDQ